jgi:hypothetical protein
MPEVPLVLARSCSIGNAPMVPRRRAAARMATTGEALPAAGEAGEGPETVWKARSAAARGRPTEGTTNRARDRDPRMASTPCCISGMVPRRTPRRGGVGRRDVSGRRGAAGRQGAGVGRSVEPSDRHWSASEVHVAHRAGRSAPRTRGMAFRRMVDTDRAARGSVPVRCVVSPPQTPHGRRTIRHPVGGRQVRAGPSGTSGVRPRLGRSVRSWAAPQQRACRGEARRAAHRPPGRRHPTAPVMVSAS